MIGEITLKFGPTQNGPPLTFSAGTVTLIVGPNNSGKSLLIRELERGFGRTNPPPLILDRLEVRSLRPSAAKWISALIPIAGHLQLRNALTGGGAGFNNLRELEQTLTDPEQANQLRNVAPLMTKKLDGSTRLSLCNDQGVGDLRSPSSGTLASLYRDDAARSQFRKHIFDSFGAHAVFDPTNVGQIRLKLSAAPLPHPDLERHLTAEAVSFFDQATPISEMSDGVRAYIGMVAAALSMNSLMILIDEPEAFLHPPLVRTLGRTLASLAGERDGTIIAATHSPEFVMGCIQSGKPVNILRLSYSGGVATARLLASNEVARLMKDARLRSATPLSALFYRSAVIAESDVDRVFYQEVNERLLAANDVACPDCLFTNVQNIQTIRLLVEPLRKMGVPAAAVVDLDIITNSEQRLLYQAAGVPNGLVKTLGQWTGEVRASFERLGREPKAVGVQALPAADREVATTLLSMLREYGVFVVPVGELERWLADLGVSARKSDWLPRVLDAMGSDPDSPDYLRPGDSDVWSFVSSVGAWLGDPQRKGMPE